MAVEYERWMSWYGKKHGPYQIEKGDFLCEEVKDKINNATWVSALVLYVRLVESFRIYKNGNRMYFTPNLIKIGHFISLSVCFCRSWKDLTQPCTKFHI